MALICYYGNNDQTFENQAMQAKGCKVISDTNSQRDKYKWEMPEIGEAGDLGNNKWAQDPVWEEKVISEKFGPSGFKSGQQKDIAWTADGEDWKGWEGCAVWQGLWKNWGQKVTWAGSTELIAKITYKAGRVQSRLLLFLASFTYCSFHWWLWREEILARKCFSASIKCG